MLTASFVAIYAERALKKLLHHGWESPGIFRVIRISKEARRCELLDGGITYCLISDWTDRAGRDQGFQEGQAKCLALSGSTIFLRQFIVHHFLPILVEIPCRVASTWNTI